MKKMNNLELMPFHQINHKYNSHKKEYPNKNQYSNYLSSKTAEPMITNQSTAPKLSFLSRTNTHLLKYKLYQLDLLNHKSRKWVRLPFWTRFANEQVTKIEEVLIQMETK